MLLEMPNVNVWLSECTEVSMDEEKKKEVLKISPFVTFVEISSKCLVPRDLFLFV